MQDKLKEAFQLFLDFKDEIMYNNRFFPDTNEFFRYLDTILLKNEIEFEAGKIFYRARIYKDEYDFTKSKEQKALERLQKASNNYNGFYGYDKYNSLAPPISQTSSGRANPEFIPYLYVAEEEYTSLVEVRPFIDEKISISKIKTLSSIKIVDFAMQDYSAEMNLLESLIYALGYFFSKPIDTTDKHEYITTQYIAEYIKKRNYDGIKFRSSLNKYGKNVVIFNSTKTEAISSEIFKVEYTSIEAKCVSPQNSIKKLHSNRLVPRLPFKK